MNELEKDPEFLRRRAEKDDKFRKLREYYQQVEHPILDRLRFVGIFEAASIDDIAKNYYPLSENIVTALLAELEPCPSDRIRESIVRTLVAAAEPFDGRILVQLHETTADEGLKWAILNTISCNKIHSIDDWLSRARQNDYIRETLEKLGYTWKA